MSIIRVASGHYRWWYVSIVRLAFSFWFAVQDLLGFIPYLWSIYKDKKAAQQFIPSVDPEAHKYWEAYGEREKKLVQVREERLRTRAARGVPISNNIIHGWVSGFQPTEQVSQGDNNA